MDFGFQILERIIKTTSFRHKVLASNIANVDTPGYKAKDVIFKDVMANPSIGLAVTDPNHIGGANNAKGSGETVVDEEADWGDGNNVSLDMELAKMTENSLLYEAGAQLLSTKIKMYKNAIKG